MFRIALLDLPVSNSTPPDLQKKYWELHTQYRYNVFYKNIELPADTFEKLGKINVGLGLIEASLRERGYKCKLYREFTELLRDINMYDVIGISCYTCNYYDALKFAVAAKAINHNMIIVIGGAHVTAVKSEVMEATPFNFAIFDIGHESFATLLTHLENKLGLDMITNLIWRDARGQIIINPPSNDLGTYSIDKSIFGCHSYEVARVFFRKGCRFHCSFCTNPRKKIYEFDRDVIFSEIDDYAQNYNTKIFYIGDEVFLSNNNISLIKRMTDLPVHWAASSHVKDFNPYIAGMIENRNCLEVSFGLESSLETIRLGVNKNLGSNDQILSLINLLQQKKINTLFFFIIGLPGQTEEVIGQEFEFMNNLLKVGILPQVDIFSPYPGSDIYLNREKYGIDIFGDYRDMVRFGSVPYNYPYIKGEDIMRLYLQGLKDYIIPQYEKMIFGQSW